MRRRTHRRSGCVGAPRPVARRDACCSRRAVERLRGAKTLRRNEQHRAMRLVHDLPAHAPDPLQAPASVGAHAEVLAELGARPDAKGSLTVSLTPEQLKITHSSVRLLLDDLQREQASGRNILRGILDKLPAEHTMWAIVLG